MFKTTIIALLLGLNTYIAIASEDKTDLVDEEGGIHVGNGGKTIVCQGEFGNKSYQALDYYEGGESFKFNLGTNKDTPEELVNVAIGRIKDIDPIRYKRLRKYLSWFNREARFIKTGSLASLSDIGLVFLKKDCELKQAVVQIPHQSKETKRKYYYAIDKKIWRALDNINRTGLILHEIIYRDLYAGSNHTTSFYVREFVRLLSSKGDDFTLSNYVSMLKNLRVKNFSYKGVKLDLTGKVQFHSDRNSIRTAKLITPQYFKVLENRVKTYSKADHHFYPNGQLIDLSVRPNYGTEPKEHRWDFNNGIKISLVAAPKKIRFMSDGRVSNIQISDKLYLQRRILFDGRLFFVAPNSKLLIDPKDQFPIKFFTNLAGKLQLHIEHTLIWKEGRYIDKGRAKIKSLYPY